MPVARRSAEIFGEPGRRVVVDAQDQFRPMCRLLRAPLSDRDPGSGLVAGRHCVLHVEDDGVRTRTERLGKPLRLVARDKEIGGGLSFAVDSA